MGMQAPFGHAPVLLDEALAGLDVRPYVAST
jgi:hypothetical protein